MTAAVLAEHRGGADLPQQADVVVVGAGHNALVCAAYLAAAGLEVVVLESSSTLGGNTRTEELTLPGFAHDSCSSAHVLLQANPLIRDDELGLLSRHGLAYVLTDPAVVLPQPDGRTLVVHRDLEATAEEVARWSPADASALRAMMAAWSGGLAAVHGRWSSGHPLGDGPAAGAYRALKARSAWDVVHERFEHDVVRSMVLWMAMATIQDPRRPGTGLLPSSLTAGRLAHGWATPVGGSSALPAALVRVLETHGGRVVCDAHVQRLEVRAGRVCAVQTADGRRVEARRAVVSSAPLQLVAGMLDGAEVPDDLAAARDAWRPGLSVFAVHAALRADLRFAGPDGPVRSVAAGLGTTTGMARQVERSARGESETEDPWLLVVDQTVVDPSRAPDGAATFKILTIAPYERSDGRSWADAKDEHAAALLGRVAGSCEGLGPEDVLAVRAESPVDVAGHNPHNLGGSCHGGEFLLPSGEVLPGWPSYETSVPGLFLTGSTSHPGGSVSGRPGRNAARAVLLGLGMRPSAVMSDA